ncbi:hypothetical protein DN069_01695 [Streptacidiphilus pinicola]|uniref:Uncharacterized protein n=1 Tax=Streptacidiphilus pinicola TaxID=2219663 RepID=A0A2X0IUH3_9ACTN|nr:hypothetical protein DN069_01695 [Streptacidiphilus pinicola]
MPQVDPERVIVTGTSQGGGCGSTAPRRLAWLREQGLAPK